MVLLNQRERFLRTLRFKDVDRVPDYEFGYWEETIDRWHEEGLPLDKQRKRDIEIYLGLEGWCHRKMLPIKRKVWPSPRSRMVKEEGGRAVIDDGMGGLYVKTIGSSSPPHYIRHPIANREDWEKLCPFLDPDTPGRFPLNWEETAKRYKQCGCPLGIGVGSLYGWLRNWMGVEAISVAFYRDPDWVAEMMDILVNLWIKIIRRALHSVKADYATWWEDMCYSRGPLLSVRHFDEFMVPRYKKVTGVLKEYGVELNILDCDGCISPLVAGWLEGGINVMFPLEARFTDIYKLRETHGRRVLLMGGVNKLALAAGGKAIDRELRRLTPMLEEGGFIPMVDHRCPPEVSYSTYRHYLKKKRKWIGRTDAPPLP